MSPSDSRRASQILLHEDGDEISPPLWLAATFAASSGDEFGEMAGVPRHPRFYTRYGNPTSERVERVVAALEGTESAILTASGISAFMAAALGLCSSGDHIVAQINQYAGINSALHRVLPRWGIEATEVDQRDAGAFVEAIGPRTRLVVMDSPSNPLLQVTDLERICRAARDRGALTLVDNTVATPILQQPAGLGADLVMHSATKLMGGHGDLMAGVLAGPSPLLNQIWETAKLLGATASPFDAWLLLRGLRTLELRARRQSETALALAGWLGQHPAVGDIHYPGLPGHPQHDLARRQMSGGFGCLLSFRLAAGGDAARAFAAAVPGTRSISLAASLGAVKTLAVHQATMVGDALSPAERDRIGVTDDLIRVSVGLDDIEDLQEDFDRVLTSLQER